MVSALWESLDAIAWTLDEDYAEAVKEQPEPTERPALEKPFRPFVLLNLPRRADFSHRP